RRRARSPRRRNAARTHGGGGDDGGRAPTRWLGGRNGMSYRVKLEVFEGPLDLLLHLIKKDEVDVYDIPVARITDQYLQYLELMRDMNLDVAGEYLVMAATLTHIKSRMLLPPSETDAEE